MLEIQNKLYEDDKLFEVPGGLIMKPFCYNSFLYRQTETQKCAPVEVPPVLKTSTTEVIEDTPLMSSSYKLTKYKEGLF